MNNLQQLKRLLSPFLNGLPIIIGCILCMVFIASKIVYYATPMYESTGRMKLEDVNMGISNTNLYKNFDVFTQPNKILAEVEVLKSSELLKQVVNTINFDVSYFRIGKIRTSELFHDSPFKVNYHQTNDVYFGKPFSLTIHSRQNYSIYFTESDIFKSVNMKFGDTLKLDGLEISIKLNDSLISKKPKLKIEDNYNFIINSTDQIIQDVSQNLDVKELDKDVPVVRIIYKNSVPEKAAIFTNKLMETYILDGIRLKNLAAQKTVNFIDTQIIVVSQKLQKSEIELERYRLEHNIANTKMEVETSLKKIAEMKIQLANIDMNIASLEKIDAYVNSNSTENFLDKAPNFEGYGGLLYTELIKRLKILQSDKKVALQKYTESNGKVKVIDSDINDVVMYIKSNISNAHQSLLLQRGEIQTAIAETENSLIDVPTKEKELIVLEREFQLNQATYNFLMEKHTESSIAEAASMSFHRIIKRAELPIKAVSPKKTFTILVFGFIGLIAGLIIVYTYDTINSKIKYKDQLEKISTCPVLIDIRHQDKKSKHNPDFFTLASKIKLHIPGKALIGITSTAEAEGKTYISENLAIAFAQIGIPSLLICADLRNNGLTNKYNIDEKGGLQEYIINEAKEDLIVKTSIENFHLLPSGKLNLPPEAIFSHKNFIQKIESLKQVYPIIIMDTSSIDSGIEAVNVMKIADLSLFVLRANYTKLKLAYEPDLLKDEYGIDNLKLILNDVPLFTKSKKGNGIRKSIQLWFKKLIPKL